MKTKLTRLILTVLLILTASALAGCGKKEGENGKKVIKIETNGRPAPFIETVENEADALYKTKDGVYLTGYDIAVLVELFKLPDGNRDG